MPDLAERALLPAGLRDILPPEAAYEAGVIQRLLAVCAGHGYQQIKPPLVEFEDTLLSGSGVAMTAHTFRLMDPVSQRMMGLRADMTIQAARIAVARLRNSPRPLRLSYAGEVLRVKGGQLRSEREFVQVGAELIGCAAAAADAEVILLAVEALRVAGVAAITVDLSSPRLVPAIATAQGLPADRMRRLMAALDRKDAAAVAAAAGDQAAIYLALLRATGPAATALPALAALDLPADAAAERRRLAAVAALMAAGDSAPAVTIDPVEHRGFEYHTGLSFTLFADRVRGELGRGGRYLAGADLMAGHGEPATGFTLYMDSIIRALPAPVESRRLYLPHGVKREAAAALRGEGWTTVAGLEPEADIRAEAKRLGCTHLWIDGGIAPVA